jgi:hypothetical protein
MAAPKGQIKQGGPIKGTSNRNTTEIRLLIKTFDLTDSNGNAIRINNFN